MSRPTAPADFDEKCGTPGNAWLADHPDADPHRYPLWTEFQPALRAAFGKRCGFLALYVPRGTVDHWVSINTDRQRAYDWANFRFVDGAVNSAKKPSWEGKLLDPYEVQEGWFEVHLPSLQLEIADIPDPAAKARAEFTLEKLKLRDGEDVLRLRREWMEMYESQKLSLEGLRDVAPLLARAIEKRDQAKPGRVD